MCGLLKKNWKVYFQGRFKDSWGQAVPSRLRAQEPGAQGQETEAGHGPSVLCCAVLCCVLFGEVWGERVCQLVTRGGPPQELSKPEARMNPWSRAGTRKADDARGPLLNSRPGHTGIPALHLTGAPTGTQTSSSEHTRGGWRRWTPAYLEGRGPPLCVCKCGGGRGRGELGCHQKKKKKRGPPNGGAGNELREPSKVYREEKRGEERGEERSTRLPF